MAVLLLHNRWVVLPIIAQSGRSFNATTFICRFRMRCHGFWSNSIDFTGLLAAYGEDFTERVLAHYQGEVDASFRDRMRFYRGVMPLNTVLFGLSTGQAAYVREGLAEMTR
jgi:hypothetical protein